MMKRVLLATSVLVLLEAMAGIASAQMPGEGLTAGTLAGPADCTPVHVSVPGLTRVEVTCEAGQEPLVAVDHLQTVPPGQLAPIVVITEGTEVKMATPDLSTPVPVTAEAETR